MDDKENQIDSEHSQQNRQVEQDSSAGSGQQMLMCPQCGTTLPVGSQVCPVCGSALTGQPLAQQSFVGDEPCSQPSVNSGTQLSPTSYSQYRPIQQVETQVRPSLAHQVANSWHTRNNRTIWIISVVLVVLAGLVSVIVPNLQSIAITLGLGPKNPLAITMESLHQIPDASSMGG